MKYLYCEPRWLTETGQWLTDSLCGAHVSKRVSEMSEGKVKLDGNQSSQSSESGRWILGKSIMA